MPPTYTYMAKASVLLADSLKDNQDVTFDLKTFKFKHINSIFLPSQFWKRRTTCTILDVAGWQFWGNDTTTRVSSEVLSTMYEMTKGADLYGRDTLRSAQNKMQLKFLIQIIK